MLNIKKSLAASVLCAVASVGFVMSVSAEKVDSEKVMEHRLKGIIVEGDADVLPGGFVVSSDRVGILGNIDAIDVPFTQKQYSQKNN